MNILYVEDNFTDGELTRKHLEKDIPDCHVIVVETLEEARKELARQKSISVVLLDLQLPDGSGIDLLSEIRRKKIKVPVIILTGRGDEESAFAMLKAGADDYVMKNKDYLNSLYRTIEYTLAHYRESLLGKEKEIPVLYVEHNQIDLELTKRHFEKYAPFLRLEYCYTADSALVMLKEAKATNQLYQALLIDYRLPGMSGLELIKEVRQILNIDLAVLMITGSGDEEIATQALRLGVDEYIVKQSNYLFRLPPMVINAVQRYELIKQQKQLQENEERFRRLAENAPDIIFKFDIVPESHFSYISPAVNKILGYSPDEFYNDPGLFEEIIHPDDRERIRKEGINQELSFIFKCYNKKRDIIWLEQRNTYLNDEKGSLTTIEGIARDITALKKTESELMAARINAEEANKLKSAFLANMSHEIRTPMNGILGFTQLLKQTAPTSEKREQYIDVINSSCDRLLTLVNDIIDISRIESGNIELHSDVANINDILTDIIGQYSPQAEDKGLVFEESGTVPKEMATFITDAPKLKQSIANLINNAIKFTNTGGVTVGYAIKNDHLELEVSDTGIGISSETQKIIFENFRQADYEYTKRYGGVGLGLSIARAYISKLGGEITVESEVGKGSTFRIRLPFVPVIKSFKEKHELRDIRSFRWEGKKVLIAEDDTNNSSLLKIIINHTGAKAILAVNGEEAVQLCMEHQPDLVLMDIKMPKKDGIEATKILQEQGYNKPVIALTAYTNELGMEGLTEMGFADFLAKPLDINELMGKLEKILS